jgi:hypothetical protein
VGGREGGREGWTDLWWLQRFGAWPEERRTRGKACRVGGGGRRRKRREKKKE